MPGEVLPLALKEDRPPSVMDLWYGGPEGETPWGTHLAMALQARWSVRKDVDYVIIDGKAKIVDQASGRLMEKTRWANQLHQVSSACRVPGLQGPCSGHFACQAE